MLSVVGLQPVFWHGSWPWFTGEPSRTVGLAYAIVNEAVEWLGAVTIVGAALAVLALGVGSRYAEPQRYGVGPRAVGVATLVLCTLFAILGIAMCVLSPDQTLITGLLWLTPFLLVPLSAVTEAARRCLVLA